MRPRKPRSVWWKRGWATAAAIAVACVGSGAWLSHALRTRDAVQAAHPQTAGRIAVQGIERLVRIDRDRNGVPQIEAETESDAFFALGFSHGQDRLAQLVRLRDQARGTAAARSGAVAVAGDRLARLIDFRGLSERQWARLAPETRRVLESYAAGVNARIEQMRRGEAAPPVALGEGAVEPWQPQDSLAVFKLFAWSLGSSIDASLVLNRLVEVLGPADAERFFPPRDTRARPAKRTTAALPGQGGRQSRPTRSEPQASEGGPLHDWVAEGARALQRVWGLSGYGVGSTAFVLGGAHTHSGRPVLVADSHFEPTVPAALYLAHLRCPTLDVAGATLPGVPIFWWGSNPRLAWASVSAGAVVTDLYAETLRKDGREYHDGRHWRPVEERDETIRVRGGEEIPFSVRQTGHGPLLPSAEGSPGEEVAVAWTGARIRGGGGIGSLLAVARAADGEAIRAALRVHQEPVIAMLWAEASGGAGLQVAGWIPRRSLASQLLPLPGRARWYDWQDPIPFEALPSAQLTAGQGFLVAADQPFQSAEGEDPIDAMWRTGARAARLGKLLSDAAREGADLRRLAALQSDVTLDRSLELLNTALALVGDDRLGEEAGELVRLLRGWDGTASADSIGSGAYHVFLDVLSEALFAERLGDDLLGRYLALPAIDLEALVLGVLQGATAGGGGDVWSDPARVRAAVAQSLRETWLALSFRYGSDPRQWRWGRIHQLRFRELAASRTALGPFAYGGAPHAVLAASYSAAEPFDVRVAATARFAIDAGALDLGLTALAPGQSEHPGHAHFEDGVGGWLAGRYTLVATRRLEIEDRSVAQLVLEPVR